MTKISDERFIVGIDPTPRGLAFVFFESGELLDWGTRRSDDGEIRLLDRLLDDVNADVLVLEDPDAPRSERRPRMKELLRRLRAHAESRGVELRLVSRHAVRSEWAKRGRTRKHAVAEAIAESFPEIDVLVPRVRKVYRSEEARAEIFDALSIVLSVFPLSRGSLSGTR
jgi:hypothetical protein